MAEEHERTNARHWDESLQYGPTTRSSQVGQQQQPNSQHDFVQDSSSTRATHGSQQQFASRPRVPLARQRPPQQSQSTSQRGNQRRPHHGRNGVIWQGELPRALPRRRIAVLSDADEVCSTMPKLLSNTPKLRAEAQQRWENRLQAEQYRQFPPPILAFESIGTFHWPVKEYRPDEVLGASSEALDPIRMSTDCYIVWSPETSTFKVLGTKKGVQKALTKLRCTCFQIASRNIAPVRKYFSHWRTEQPCLYVHLDDEYENPQYLVPPGESTGFSQFSKTPRADGEMIEESDLEEAKAREAHGIGIVKKTLTDSFHKVHYLRAHIQFRIRLGIFVLTSHKFLDAGDMWELCEYHEMTDMPQFRGRVTEELGDRATENGALACLQSANDLLTPHDNMQSELSEVKPTYSVDFVFKHDDGNLQLTMAWSRNQDRAGDGFHFVLAKEKWTRLDRDTGKAMDLVDMDLVDLHTGSAWNFDIKTSQAVEPVRVPVELRAFGKRVNISAKHGADHPTVTWTYTISLVSVRESTIYRYGINRSDYTLELSQFQIRDVASGQLPAGNAAVKEYEKRWGLSVYRTEWDNEFAKNERLKISDKAKWEDKFEEWFPADDSLEEEGDGFKQLLEKLERIEKLVREHA